MKPNETTVIIVAAGSGSRFGSTLPKQFSILAGKPVVMHSIERFRRFVPGVKIILVLSDERTGYWHELCSKYRFDSPTTVTGGKTRWESVKNALEFLDEETTTVMVHDAARPLVSHEVISRLSEALEAGAEGALPVLPLTDSIRELTPDGASRAVDRSRYVAVQTPQAFPKKLLMEAYGHPYCGTMTDDASVIEAAGHFDIRLVEGDGATLKITRPIDLALTEIYLNGTPEGN